MKKYSLYFLSLILTLSAWTSSHAQESIFTMLEEKRLLNEAEEIANSNKNKAIRYNAKGARHVGVLATYVEIFDEDGDYVCTAENFEPSAQDRTLVVSPCGDYTLTAYVTRMDHDKFVYSLYDGDSNQPFAVAVYSWWWARDDNKKSFVEYMMTAPLVDKAKP